MYFVSKLQVLRFESLLKFRILEILNFHQSNSEHCTIRLILRSCILIHVLLNLEKCVDPDYWHLKKPTDQDPHKQHVKTGHN